MSTLDLLQWPAMLTTIGAAWLVASTSRRRRHGGFWLYLASNALWIGWGWPAHAYALIVLQGFLVVTNLRGLRKTWNSAETPSSVNAVSVDGAIPTRAQARVQILGDGGVAAQAQGTVVAQPAVGPALGDRQAVVGLPHRDQPIPLPESEVGEDAEGERGPFRP